MDDPTDSIIYGPSTSNKIERWWRELHERLEKFFKEQLTALLRGRECDPHVALDRQLLAYVFIPIVQRECDIFVNYWNSHRIRGQDKLEIPAGVPDHMFSFLEQYRGTNMGIPLSKDELREVADVSGVMDEEGMFATPFKSRKSGIKECYGSILVSSEEYYISLGYWIKSTYVFLIQPERLSSC